MTLVAVDTMLRRGATRELDEPDERLVRPGYAEFEGALLDRIHGRQVVSRLRGNARDIVRWKLEGRSFKWIGEELGVSAMRVCQMFGAIVRHIEWLQRDLRAERMAAVTRKARREDALARAAKRTDVALARYEHGRFGHLFDAPAPPPSREAWAVWREGGWADRDPSGLAPYYDNQAAAAARVAELGGGEAVRIR